MSSSRPRVRTWRRTLRALALSGRARAARLEAEVSADESGAAGSGAAADGRGVASGALLHLSPDPRATALALDRGPLAPAAMGRPRQGALGDCWVMASMLAVHETAPEHLRSVLTPENDGVVAVHLPGLDAPLRVDRCLPVDERGNFVYGRRDGANPGWVGVLEKAIAGHVAGGYGMLQRGFARYGLQILTGQPVRSQLRLPDATQILAWRAEHRAICASTHPLSPRVQTAAGPLPPNHVFAVVGADARSGHVQLRNPTRPSALLVVDARTFRRGFLSVDVTAPLR